MAGFKRDNEREYYLEKGRARQYDKRTSGGTSVERQREAARTVGRYLRAGRVLDIGCGSGRMLIEMARMLPALELTGIDVSEEMISLGAGNVRKADLADRIELKVMSAEGLDAFSSGSFEMVMSHGSFSGWLDPSASLTEVRRILRPGGYLFIRDWCRSAPREALEPYLSSAEGNSEHIRRVEMAFASSYAEEELKELLTLKGMATIEFFREGLWVSAVLHKS